MFFIVPQQRSLVLECIGNFVDILGKGWKWNKCLSNLRSCSKECGWASDIASSLLPIRQIFLRCERDFVLFHARFCLGQSRANVRCLKLHPLQPLLLAGECRFFTAFILKPDSTTIESKNFPPYIQSFTIELKISQQKGHWTSLKYIQWNWGVWGAQQKDTKRIELSYTFIYLLYIPIYIWI